MILFILLLLASPAEAYVTVEEQEEYKYECQAKCYVPCPDDMNANQCMDLMNLCTETCIEKKIGLLMLEEMERAIKQEKLKEVTP